MSIEKDEFIVKIDLPDKQIEEDVNLELQDYSVDDPFGITEAMSKQPSRYLKWADLHRKAVRVQKTIERDYEIWHAKAIKNIREVLARKEGNSKPTIADLTNGVKIYYNKNYTIWNNKKDKAEDNSATLEMIVKATLIKKDMLVSVGQLCSRLIDSSNLVVKDKKISKR